MHVEVLGAAGGQLGDHGARPGLRGVGRGQHARNAELAELEALLLVEIAHPDERDELGAQRLGQGELGQAVPEGGPQHHAGGGAARRGRRVLQIGVRVQPQHREPPGADPGHRVLQAGQVRGAVPAEQDRGPLALRQGLERRVPGAQHAAQAVHGGAEGIAGLEGHGHLAQGRPGQVAAECVGPVGEAQGARRRGPLPLGNQQEARRTHRGDSLSSDVRLPIVRGPGYSGAVTKSMSSSTRPSRLGSRS